MGLRVSSPIPRHETSCPVDMPVSLSVSESLRLQGSLTASLRTRRRRRKKPVVKPRANPHTAAVVVAMAGTMRPATSFTFARIEEILLLLLLLSTPLIEPNWKWFAILVEPFVLRSLFGCTSNLNRASWNVSECLHVYELFLFPRPGKTSS